MIKELPILMTTDMVRANLAGAKSETRRLSGLDLVNKDPDNWTLTDLIIRDDGRLCARFTAKCHCATHDAVCRYGTPGNHLWVRETWVSDMLMRIAFKTDIGASATFRWKPSIHMKKSVARIWLNVTSVHYERLQSITEKASMAEGIHEFSKGTERRYGLENWSWSEMQYTAKGAYMRLWDSINAKGKKPMPWKNNPWVCVIGYEIISVNGKAKEATGTTGI